MPRYGYLLPTRGVVLTSDDRPTLASKVDSDVIGLARRAESAGFGGVWVGDSVLAKPRLEPLATLSAVAGATESVDLGTAVYLPALRHPVHVAHATATLDLLSGGRLHLGVGVGIGDAVLAEYETLGYDYRARGARLDEALSVLTRLWDGETVTHDGDFVQLDEASIGFSPSRNPPIYIPSPSFDPDDGFPGRIHDRLLTHGDGWLPTRLSPERYGESLAGIRSLLAEEGRDPDAFEAAYYLDAVIHEDESVALEQARRFYDQYYPSWDTLSDEEIRERGAFGTPESVAATLVAYDDAGVENVVVRFTSPDQRSQLDRFAKLAL